MMSEWARYMATAMHVQERRGGLGPEMEMQCQECGASVTFLNPDAKRVQWFASSHRCAGPGATWQGTAR